MPAKSTGYAPVRRRWAHAARARRAVGSGGLISASTKANCSSRDRRIDLCSAITRRAASCALATTNSLSVRLDSAAAS
jgi:hypothetical protein